MRRIFLAVLVCAALAESTVAQLRPDFSGTWKMDEERSGSAVHDTFVGPVSWVVKQATNQVVVERTHGGRAVSFTYTVSEKRPPARRADPVVESAADAAPAHQAYWDTERLVLETPQTIQGKTVTTREVLTLASGGRELIVERVVEVEHGYTMKGAQNFSAVKDTFVKVVP